MKKCQVIFFPLKHFPDIEETHRLQGIQDAITFTRQEIKYMSGNPYKEAILKLNFHKKLRKKMKLIAGTSLDI